MQAISVRLNSKAKKSTPGDTSVRMADGWAFYFFAAS